VPRLAIVIVTYNSAAEIAACLTALPTAARQTPYDVVVVDNGSADGTVALVRAGNPEARVIDAGGNLGFARANNLGIRATSSELVLLLNPDTIPGTGAIDALVGVLDADARVAVAGPRIVDRAGRAELSFGAMIDPLAELRQKLFTRGHDRGWPVLSAQVERWAHEPGFPDWVSGACLLIRRASLERAGLLDERFFLYTEDVDLCAAVRAQGGVVRFSPEAQIMHARGASRARAGRRSSRGGRSPRRNATRSSASRCGAPPWTPGSGPAPSSSSSRSTCRSRPISRRTSRSPSPSAGSRPAPSPTS
jgi:GT2 family glycosyltransferase